MRALTVVSSLALIATAVSACDFTRAVDSCASPSQTRCGMWKCLVAKCPTEFNVGLKVTTCAGPNADDFVYGDVSGAIPSRVNDGNDDAHAASAHRHRSGAPPQAVAGATPEVNSPCLQGAKGFWDKSVIRALLYSFAMDVYAGRFNETYTENMTLRWIGIHDHICPPAVPRYSDCSSTVTWLYWTLFGNGTDFMNGENWEAGYTGTLKEHGVNVTGFTDAANLEVGDLCFYYHPMHHVAIYVGDSKVVTHGMDPVGYYPFNYAPLDFCIRYIG